MMFVGCVYVTGVFSPYILSYFGMEKDSTLPQDLLPACLVANMFLIPLGSYLTQKGWNPRVLILMGGCFTFPAFYVASFVSDFWAFAMLYVLGFSWSQGMTYMISVHHSWLWFPNNQGLVSGIILGGFGFGALIFDNVLTHLINPNNESIQDNGYYPDDVNDNFEMTWRVMVSCWLALALIGLALIFPGPEPKKRAGTVDIEER